MHLLAAEPGAISDGTVPVDPGQTPADIVFLSAADTELALLAEARAAMPDPPSLRLLNLAHLRHPMSVDLHLEACATRSRLVVARLLGGAGYWPYGFEQYRIRLAAAGVPFAALPGDDKPAPELLRASTVAAEDWHALLACLVEGGPDNAAAFLSHAAHMLDRSRPAPPPARPLLRAGVWWPGLATATPAALRAHWCEGAPVVPVVFYRALLQGAGLDPLIRLVRALVRRGLNPLPVFVASLKDAVSAATLAALFAETPPAVIVNLTAFAVGTPEGGPGADPLAGAGVPVLQAVLSGGTAAEWEAGTAGLAARDIAMHVALPEVDGRILTRAIGFKAAAFRDGATQCTIVTSRAVQDRVEFVADLAAGWARLARTPRAERRIAIVLANYPNRDGRLANGVGLDTPASAVAILRLLAGAGYRVADIPADGAALMARLRAGPTNAGRAGRTGGETLPLADYLAFWNRLPPAVRQKVVDRWGPPEADPTLERGEIDGGGFRLPLHRFGNVVLGIQPARGYNIDPRATYHAPDLVPPHHYLAFHAFLRGTFGVQAVVHLGKHGNLEWLPGKALALSEGCFPEVALGPLPHLYPFIVNDPGEGAQAKRRAQAVILDHLTPPLTRAGSYGPLAELEGLIDEYAEAAPLDRARRLHLRREILDRAAAAGLDRDAGLAGAPDEDAALIRLDAWLCDVKEAQIRDGLHVFAASPEGTQARDLAIAIARLPRGDGQGRQASLIRALARDCGIDPGRFDPLACDLAAPWDGPRHPALADAAPGPWRTAGDTVERLERLAEAAIGWKETPAAFRHAAPVLAELHDSILPAIAACGPAEAANLLAGLDGRLVPPGPSGAPTRGRPEVLPTGRNFYSVDTRALPTPAAWTLGWASAGALIERHLETEGDWPRALLITAWGTATMRTGGDDIAQALALIGARPRWEPATRRVTGFEILPPSVLGRPRVDVTLRVSGFFRDAFPGLIDLFDSAARAVMALDEPAAANPAAARFRAEGGDRRAGFRIFGAKPGAYGAGLQALIDERIWERREELGAAWLDWGGWAYGDGAAGLPARDLLSARMGLVDGIVQNQDNREHDLLDSDDYYQFEGGAAAAAAAVQGRERPVWHMDHSRPERPVARSLTEEIARVMRSRVLNPRWIEGVKRHGYKGAFEIAATVDYLFAFAATTRAVADHHFDLVAATFLGDPASRDFIAEANPDALREIAARLAEAIDRGLWQPRRNALRAELERLASPLATSAP
jgi:cobaltochelatase CobN